MRRLLITFLCVLTLAVAGQRARGFALLGPFAGFDATWQTPTIGYLSAKGIFDEIPGGPEFLVDIGGPKNVGEGYRRNERVIFYAYDNNFSSFFGLQGETNADLAFAIMNGVFSVTNGVDGYSPNLTEFPFNSQHFNGTAQGLYLTDLKSQILHLLVEQMGLAQPERFTWTLRSRATGPGGCPVDTQYTVLQRNYGTADQPINGPQTGTFYSPYVNNLYYTYSILEDCAAPGFPYDAVAYAQSTDTTVPEYTSVAANTYAGFLSSLFEGVGGGLQVGGYYTGLTEDDVAGLRYLMSSNNIVFETPSAGAQEEVTNTSSLQLLQTSSLYELYQFAQTNPPAAVSAQFPGIVINSVTNSFQLESNPVVFSYFTNFPGSPAGTLPTFVTGTNTFTFFVQTNFTYTFGNVIAVEFHSNTPAKLETTSLKIKPGSPVENPIIETNVTIQNIILTNVISGDYYLIPTNSCGLDIVGTLVTNNFAGAFTNVITSATNGATTNASGFVGSESIVVNFTNNWFEYFPCQFVTSGPAYYQGIQGVQFVRVADANVDPLTQVFYQPVTNTYTMIMVTNHMRVPQTFQRIATQPDILMTAEDLATPGPPPTESFGSVARTINFEEGEILPNLSGPGVIDGQSVFVFNRIGTTWWNGPFPDKNSFLVGPQSEINQDTAVPGFLWASFDGTTNPPTIYPSYLSIQELQSSMVITVSPTSLPISTHGQAYLQTLFSATGGQPPYSWSVAPGSTLPTGLYINNGTLEGLPNGNTNGVYSTIIQLMDSSFPTNVVDTTYSITNVSN